ASVDPAPSAQGPVVDCVVRPETTEGPYFIDDESLRRRDIRADPSNGSISEGIPLRLDLGAISVGATRLRPIRDAVVDLWQCDALGVYSNLENELTLGQKFLRGYQFTNRNGRARFVTILPGWYESRAVHLHVKVRTTGSNGTPYEFTSQLYFPEKFSEMYLRTEHYVANGSADTVNSTDPLYAADSGEQMLLAPKRSGRRYAASFTIGMDLSDTAVGDDDPFVPPPGFVLPRRDEAPGS
ncbi:MAG: twin-arginine translocation pathway signal protein, partial [Angustibacter sp.]